MKVIDGANFGIYIYPNDHPPPHCHVRYRDGSDISVDIPLIMPRYGATLSKEVENAIESNLTKICSTWERLNNSKK